MDETHRKWLWSQLAERTVENLNKHGFDARFAETTDKAEPIILNLSAGHASYGFAGSSTTRALNLPETLKKRGATIFDHWQQGLAPEDDLQIRLEQGRCDCFFTSANAIAATGEIVNVDGVGNRTNAMTFGPKKVIVVAGMNKVTPDLDPAIRRVHDVAAPMRAKSLNMDTPCAKTGQCNDCNVPQRICRVTTILHRRPMLTDVSVVLINETLGF
jgi:L-lactate utilization protein LutB